MAHWVGAQGQTNSPKMRKHALIVTSLPENPQSKSFFKSAVDDLLNP